MELYDTTRLVVVASSPSSTFFCLASIVFKRVRVCARPDSRQRWLVSPSIGVAPVIPFLSLTPLDLPSRYGLFTPFFPFLHSFPAPPPSRHCSTPLRRRSTGWLATDGMGSGHAAFLRSRVGSRISVCVLRSVALCVGRDLCRRRHWIRSPELSGRRREAALPQVETVR